LKYDQYGRTFATSDELCNLLYKNPNIDLSLFLVEDPQDFNKSRAELHADVPNLKGYVTLADSVEIFDERFQSKWRMSDEYKELDIAEYVLSLCTQDYELQRVGEELLLFQERNLFNLLRYMKYLVDTLRKNNIVWGVGRGSSVASYVLFLLGVHKINSIYYDLSIDEFLK
jgi:DNA polymerase III alpha subunit